MWQVLNYTPYGAGKSWIRDKTGQSHWLVAIKATFDILEGGRLRRSEEQPPPLLAPEFWGDPATTSLREDWEVTPPKLSTDVLVVGSAYAPGGRPAPSVLVSLRFADVFKTLVVHGPRVYGDGLSAGEGEPFVSAPIRYESAFGGSDLSSPDPRQHRFDPRNPVGRGVGGPEGQRLTGLAHTIEYPDGIASRRGPAGFGPIASFWSPRRERGGTYDEAWEKRKKPLLPDDHDERSWLCAPDDQWPSSPLRGGEIIQLQNLTPGGLLQVELPKLYFAFSTKFGSRVEQHRARLGTVTLAPDVGKLSMVWQTALAVRATEADYLDETRVLEKEYIA